MLEGTIKVEETMERNYHVIRLWSRVDYGFVDTLDDSIHASKQRAMAAVESVNLRVNYQASVHRRESEERADVDDHATGHIMRIQTLEARARIDTLEDTEKMAPKRTTRSTPATTNTTTAPMIDAHINALIDQGVVDALAVREVSDKKPGKQSQP
ncbi:hypothetical protein Tco_0619969 [Tanacetum coccineum]